MDFGPILEAFRLQKSIKIAINFEIDFWTAEKSIRDQKQSSSVAQAPPLRTPEGVLTGLQYCSPVVRRTRTLEKRTGASDLTRRVPVARRILKVSARIEVWNHSEIKIEHFGKV